MEEEDLEIGEVESSSAGPGASTSEHVSSAIGSGKPWENLVTSQLQGTVASLGTWQELERAVAESEVSTSLIELFRVWASSRGFVDFAHYLLRDFLNEKEAWRGYVTHEVRQKATELTSIKDFYQGDLAGNLDEGFKTTLDAFIRWMRNTYGPAVSLELIKYISLSEWGRKVTPKIQEDARLLEPENFDNFLTKQVKGENYALSNLFSAWAKSNGDNARAVEAYISKEGVDALLNSRVYVNRIAERYEAYQLYTEAAEAGHTFGLYEAYNAFLKAQKAEVDGAIQHYKIYLQVLKENPVLSTDENPEQVHRVRSALRRYLDLMVDPGEEVEIYQRVLAEPLGTVRTVDPPSETELLLSQGKYEPPVAQRLKEANEKYEGLVPEVLERFKQDILHPPPFSELQDALDKFIQVVLADTQTVGEAEDPQRRAAILQEFKQDVENADPSSSDRWGGWSQETSGSQAEKSEHKEQLALKDSKKGDVTTSSHSTPDASGLSTPQNVSSSSSDSPRSGPLLSPIREWGEEDQEGQESQESLPEVTQDSLQTHQRQKSAEKIKGSHRRADSSHGAQTPSYVTPRGENEDEDEDYYSSDKEEASYREETHGSQEHQTQPDPGHQEWDAQSDSQSPTQQSEHVEDSTHGEEHSRGEEEES